MSSECVCILGCVRVIEWSFLFLFPFSPILFYSHIHMSSHTVILMRGGQDSLQNSRFIKPEYSGGVCVRTLIPANTGSMNTITSHTKLNFLLVDSGLLQVTSILERPPFYRGWSLLWLVLRSLNGGHCWCRSAALHIDSAERLKTWLIDSY